MTMPRKELRHLPLAFMTYLWSMHLSPGSDWMYESSLFRTGSRLALVKVGSGWYGEAVELAVFLEALVSLRVRSIFYSNLYIK